MALGDGTTWDVTLPDNTVVANLIDEYNRDLRAGIQARMHLEHIWAATQVATNEAGLHRYITMTRQVSAPALVVGTQTQQGAVWVKSSGLDLFFTNSASTDAAVILAAFDQTVAGTKTLTTLPLLPATTATTDNEAASKKYVDNQTTTPAQMVKGWASITWAGGTPTLQDNFNVSGINDDGIGLITISWDTNFADANYCVVATPKDNGHAIAQVLSIAAGTVQIKCRDLDQNDEEVEALYVMAIGSQ